MSEYFRKSVRVTAPDGRVRTARVKCHRYDGSFAADTWFSVPASMRVLGKYVAGYVTGGDDGLEFRVYHRYAHAFK
jgi:hypothetical protein